MLSLRTRAWIAAAASIIAMIGISGLGAARIAKFNRDTPREIRAFNPVYDREFTFAGRPVTLKDDVRQGITYVVLTYGDQSVRIPASLPGDPRLPGLLSHEDWLRVLRYATASSMSLDDLQRRLKSGESTEHIAVVTRAPEPGTDLRGKGGSNRRAWVFDFYELTPEGAIVTERFRFPSKKAERTPGPPILTEGSWQFEAALIVMPPGSAPTPKFLNDGLLAMGWTVPAAAGAMLLAIFFAAVGMWATAKPSPTKA